MSGDMSKKVKVGSRKSELALVQTRHVISLLSKLYPEKEFDIVTMSTLGDKVLDIPLPKIGEKSLFTKELETALITGSVDFVVHSLKDLPTTLPKGMAIGAVLDREDPRDALVVRKGFDSKCLSDLPPGSIIGTSSLRRTAQLARTYPNLKVESIRGNLNTRMKKLDELNRFSAIVLAQAGLDRMGWHDRITKILDNDEMLYAVGQGALAVECRENDVEILSLLQPLHNANTVLRILAERSFLKTLGGGCSAPVAVTSNLLNFEDNLILELTGAVWSLDGTIELKDKEKCTVEIKYSSKRQINGEPICPLGFTRELVVASQSCHSCPAKKANDKKKFTSSIAYEKAKFGSVENETLKSHAQCPINICNKAMKSKHGNETFNNHEICPHKKIKLMPKEDESTAGHEEHCPLDIPVGLDFMGKCPYLNMKDEANDTSTPEIENLINEFGKSSDKCPYLEGKIDVTDEIPNDLIKTDKLQMKNDVTKPIICPYRESKLYCGIVPCLQTPLWALEQAEHLGINLAENLLKRGALDVMQAAQMTIRGS